MKLSPMKNYHRFPWYATFQIKTPAETFPKFLSIMRVIDRSNRNPPITTTSVTFWPSLHHASGLDISLENCFLGFVGWGVMGRGIKYFHYQLSWYTALMLQSNKFISKSKVFVFSILCFVLCKGSPVTTLSFAHASHHLQSIFFSFLVVLWKQEWSQTRWVSVLLQVHVCCS